MIIDNIIAHTPALKRLESRRIAIQKSTGDSNLEPFEFEGEFPFVREVPRVRAYNWICQDCGLSSTNLWLNLSDGSILCGRKYREGTIFTGEDEILGSPGHGHAYKNYRETGHPLIVNVHSINPWGARCYSYKQDNFVHVENLSSYFERLGILTLKNAEADFAVFNSAESARNSVKLAPDEEKAAKTQELGRVGIATSAVVRSSLTSAIQLLARSAPMSIYSSLIPHFFEKTTHPLSDFNVQFGKVVNGLLHDVPSEWSSTHSSSLSLAMIFNILSIEIENFLAHNVCPVDLVKQLLEIIRQKLSPSPSLKFRSSIQEIVTCILSGGVSVKNIDQFMIEVPIKQTLEQALEDWSTEPLESFFSPNLQEQAPAQRNRKFTVFPDKLLIAPQRYFKNSEWVNEEYRIGMSVNNQLDLSSFQLSDEIEPDMEIDHDATPVTGTVKILVEMGFGEKLARKALDRTAWDLEAAAEWCCMHLDEGLEPEEPVQPENTENSGSPTAYEPPDTFIVPNEYQEELVRNDPIEFKTFEWKTKRFALPDDDYVPREFTMYQPTEEQVQQLEYLGIMRGLAVKSLRITRGDVERAADWAFNNWDSPIDESDLELAANPNAELPELESVDEIQLTEEEIAAKTRRVQETISQLQQEGQLLLKEIKDPKKEFVEAMVAKIEGNPIKSTNPKQIKPKKRVSLRSSTFIDHNGTNDNVEPNFRFYLPSI